MSDLGCRVKEMPMCRVKGMPKVKKVIIIECRVRGMEKGEEHLGIGD